MKQLATCLVALAIALPAFAGGDTSANPEARVYFANLADGDTVSSPVTVIFGLTGMDLAPAGTEAENTGHHHLLVDRPPMGQGADGAEELTYAIPADDNHLHFGKGQTEVTLDLAAGTHTLQLVMGDFTHVPHATPVMSEVITIKVE